MIVGAQQVHHQTKLLEALLHGTVCTGLVRDNRAVPGGPRATLKLFVHARRHTQLPSHHAREHARECIGPAAGRVSHNPLPLRQRRAAGCPTSQSRGLFNHRGLPRAACMRSYPRKGPPLTSCHRAQTPRPPGLVRWAAAPTATAQTSGDRRLTRCWPAGPAPGAP